MSESIEAEKSAPLDLIREKAGIELKQAQRTCWREIPWRSSTRMFDSDRATEASKNFALRLFNGRAEGVFRRESDYDVFKSELDETAANVVAELEQEWRTFSPGSLDEAHVGLTMTCIPAVRRALAENQETWRLRFLDTQLETIDTGPSANANSSECERTELSEVSRPPLAELQALGLTVPISQETAEKLWVALLRIDAGVRRKGPGLPAEPVQAAYQAIATHVVNTETPNQVLEEMIPQIIFSFASTRPWSRYGNLEILRFVLEPCILEWKAARLEMSTAAGPEARAVSPRGANVEPTDSPGYEHYHLGLRSGTFKRIVPPEPGPVPGALSPGQEYPRDIYHATQAPRMVVNRQEELAAGQEWSRKYIFQEFPKVKYHWNGKNVTVKNRDEEIALGPGWADNPSVFEPFRGPRPVRTSAQDPIRWVGEWSIPGLTPDLRKKICARLLWADADFDKATDPDAGALEAMRRAFDSIAATLFEAGILTESVLRANLPELIWDSAVAGAWWRLASDVPMSIFPEQIGRCFIWRGESPAAQSLFRAETNKWIATILDSPAPAEAEVDSSSHTIAGDDERTDTTQSAPSTELASGDRATQAEPPAEHSQSGVPPDELARQQRIAAIAKRRRAVVMPILKEKRWKRAKWATQSGVGKNSVYEYLDGKRNLSDENRTAMAQELGLKPEDLPG